MGRSAFAALTFAALAAAQPRTILAVGAHAADMELSAGALLARQHQLGDRVVLLHLTAGEGGNPQRTPADYGAQKKKEALAAAAKLGAEVRFGPYADGLLPDDEASRRYVAGVIREVQPAIVITHWKNSIHKDHRVASALVQDAVLLASVATLESAQQPWRGVRAVYYADNWEDAEGFRPYLLVDVTEAYDLWTEAIREYQMVRGGVSKFAYFDYYTAHARQTGALAGRRYAVALDVDEQAKRRVVDALR